MKLNYRAPTLDEALQSTLWTQEDGITPYWRDWLYRVYPSLDKEKILALPWIQRKKYLSQELGRIYYEILPQLKSQAKHWNQLFQNQKDDLDQAFSSAFETDIRKILNDMFACPNLNPISPRYLEQHSFFLFYRMDNKIVFYTSLHEIMHFIWFHQWQKYFHDNPKEYDTPHLKWIYSEMVTDTFARFSKLKKFFGNYPVAYDYFYTLKIDGKSLLNTLGKIYQKDGIKGLFNQGFELVKKNEEQIRKHIEISESKGTKKRCSWVDESDGIYVQYHDHEWGIPVHDEHLLFEMLVLESFQSGLSWQCILHKREAFRQAFDFFDVNRVALYNQDKINQLLQDQKIVRHLGKIKAAIQNAKIFIKIQDEFGSFDAYIWHWTKGKIVRGDGFGPISNLSDQIAKDMKKRGIQFMGRTTVLSYLCAIGIVDGHQEQCCCFKP